MMSKQPVNEGDCAREAVGHTALLEIPVVAALVASTPVTRLGAGETLFETGDLCTRLPVIDAGIVKLHVNDKAGLQEKRYHLKPGTVCPVSLSLLLQHRAYPATAVAVTDVQVRYIPGEALLDTISGSHDAFTVFISLFASYLCDPICAPDL